MNTVTSNTSNVNTIHRSTAEQALVRAMKFLRTVGADSSVRAAMARTGFQVEDLKQGWSLLLKACAAPVADTRFTPEAGPAPAATAEVQAWQSTMFLRAHAALRRLHPQQDAFLFDGLSAGAGVGAVVAVSIFLDRLDALETASGRADTAEQDRAALATLERRGLTKDERKKARDLVTLVESTPAPVLSQVAPPTDERLQALTELHAWVQDWSDCARAVISRRDQLLRLGIGKRKSRGSSDAATAPEAPVVGPVVSAPAPAVKPAAGPTLVEIAARPIAALPPAQLNGKSNGVAALPANGGAHA